MKKRATSYLQPVRHVMPTFALPFCFLCLYTGYCFAQDAQDSVKRNIKWESVNRIPGENAKTYEYTIKYTIINEGSKDYEVMLPDVITFCSGGVGGFRVEGVRYVTEIR